MSYCVPCFHERDGVLHTMRVEDYWPLTRDQVKKLLIAAHEFAAQPDVRRFSDIQCRFAQAIPGAKCPSELDNWTAKRSEQMDELFVHTATFDVTDALLDLFCSLMEPDPTSPS